MNVEELPCNYLIILQAAERLNCSLFVHPWDMQTDGRMSKYWLPWLVGELYVIMVNLSHT